MKLKINVIIGLTAVLFLLTACGAAQPTGVEQTTPDTTTEVNTGNEPVLKTIQINSTQVPCEGAGPQMCYQFRESPDAAWQLWYDDIEGFEFEEGNLYTLQIAETTVENPPQDRSAVAWSLIAVESVEPVGVGSGDAAAVAEQAPSTETEQADFVPVAVEDLGIEAVVPADWLPIGDDPLIANGWGLDQLTFVSFNAAPGDDAKQALAELVSVDPTAFTDGSLAGEYDEVEVNGRFWAIYTQLNPDINLAQTAAITEEDGTVYLVSLFVDSEQTEPILLPVLEGFAISGIEVMAEETESEAVAEATRAPEDMTEPVGLVGTAWNMLTMNGNPPAEGTQITAVFDTNGTVNGYSGCNDYFGPYSTDETTLSAGPLAVTRRACDETTGPQEIAYLDALESVTNYQITDNQLMLANASGEIVLTYSTTESLALQGPTWNLTAYLDGGPLVSTLPDESVTAVFGTSNILSGSGGCNTYSADYNLDQTQLSIGLPRATLTNCAEPAGIMRTEALYLNLLTAVASYTIDATTLSLFDAEGALLLTYTVSE
ncbi:MAG: META domain-containing protein [Anaerolineales bacterium]|nr:META domain-containing protein [Anaerolineales bacterium]